MFSIIDAAVHNDLHALTSYAVFRIFAAKTDLYDISTGFEYLVFFPGGNHTENKIKFSFFSDIFDLLVMFHPYHTL